MSEDSDKGLVDDPRLKPARGLVSDLHPIRPIADGKEKSIGKFGPDVVLTTEDVSPLDDGRPKRKLVDPVYDKPLVP